MNMIRCLYAFFIAITLNCDSAFAQIEIGITGGAVYSGISLKEELITRKIFLGPAVPSIETEYLTGQTSYSWGYYGGLQLNKRISNSFRIQLGILYLEKGWEEDLKYSYNHVSMDDRDIRPFINYSESIKYRSIEVPLLLNFTTPLNKSLISFGIGPYIGFRLNGFIVSSVQNYENSTDFPSSHISDLSAQIAETPKRKIVFGDKKSNCDCLYGNKIDYGSYFNLSLLLRNSLSIGLTYKIGLEDVLTDRFLIFPNRERALLFGISYSIFNKE